MFFTRRQLFPIASQGKIAWERSPENNLEELKLVKKKFRIVSILLTVVMLMSAFVTPVAAGQGNGRGQERKSESQIQYLDAEVQVIDGQPVLRYETEDGYVDIPFEIPAYALSADGQKVAVERQGDAILLPTEDGFEAVPLKDFSVVMINGQIMLLAEVNAPWLIPVVLIAARVILGGLVVIVGGSVAREIEHWMSGLCASPWCSQPDPGFDLFCGLRNCPATIHGFFIPGHWLQG